MFFSAQSEKKNKSQVFGHPPSRDCELPGPRLHLLVALGLCSLPKKSYYEGRGWGGGGGLKGARARDEAGGSIPPICEQK